MIFTVFVFTCLSSSSFLTTCLPKKHFANHHQNVGLCLRLVVEWAWCFCRTMHSLRTKITMRRRSCPEGAAWSLWVCMLIQNRSCWEVSRTKFLEPSFIASIFCVYFMKNVACHVVWYVVWCGCGVVVCRGVVWRCGVGLWWCGGVVAWLCQQSRCYFHIQSFKRTFQKWRESCGEGLFHIQMDIHIALTFFVITHNMFEGFLYFQSNT